MTRDVLHTTEYFSKCFFSELRSQALYFSFGIYLVVILVYTQITIKVVRKKAIGTIFCVEGYIFLLVAGKN